ncbi:hypothetical protein RI129_012714 [Pyrocoelia pectoralis]|uniref:Fructose-bisphosphate aldolase n=1 Tax=Pyrocoelia pectoralis TaxID=417401 RepID=A0AAN7V7S8_9COLE
MKMTLNISRETRNDLKLTAQAILHRGKGILAVDESGNVLNMESIGVKDTSENRRKYRQLLFQTEDLSQYISAVILFDETLHQKTDQGVPLIKLLQVQGIIPGIKVDTGIVPLVGSEEEFSTEGLDGLGKRCAEYKKKGCRFAKWRSIFKIRNGKPSDYAIKHNADILAQYAAICQSNKLVPILEPEVLVDGTHDIDRCQRVTEKVLVAVYTALHEHDVYLEGTVLKCNMVTAGQLHDVSLTSDTIARATVATLQRTVPAAIAGITFLSGGQSEEKATVNLNAINRCTGKKPWTLSFSFGRALQASALKKWGGKDENTLIAQTELINRAKANSEATLGQYRTGAVRGECCSDELFVKDYVY